MDLHNEYMSIPTVDLSFHLDTNSDPPTFLSLQKTITKYNNLICENNLDLVQANSFRCLLVYQYQKSVQQNSFPNFNEDQITGLKIPILSQLATLNWLSTDEKIIKDIMILQSVLFSRAKILQTFESVNLDEDSSANILEIVLSSLRLCLHLKLEETKMSPEVTRCLKSMITKLSQANFLQTANTLKLCFETFGYLETTEQIWTTILDRLENENVLNLLCFLTGNCLPEDDSSLKFLYDPVLWKFYLKNINDPVPMKRKQANFMISKTLNMKGTLEVEESEGFDIVPFLCSGDDAEILELKQLFLLTLDALEETQKQFALQAVVHLGKMVSHPKRDSLGIIWLKKLFQRALTHDSRTVIFQSLTQVLKLDLQFYDEEMLKIICGSLNEVRFYATDEMLQKLDLASWMQRLELGCSGSVSRLVHLISKENLNLVATFHMIDALRSVNQVTEFWSELTVKSLVEIVKKNQPLQLNLIHFELERCALQLLLKFVKEKNLIFLSEPLTFLLKRNSNQKEHQKVFNWLFDVELEKLKTLPESVTDQIIDYINLGMSKESTLDEFTFSSMLDFFFRMEICLINTNLHRTLNRHFKDLENLSSRPYCDVDLVFRLIKLLTFNVRSLQRFASHYNSEVTEFILQKCLDVKNLDFDQLMVLINYKRVLELPSNQLVKVLEDVVKQVIEIFEKGAYSIKTLQYPFLIGLLGVCVRPKSTNRVEAMKLVLKMYKVKPELNPDDPIRDQVFSFFYQSLLRVILTCTTSNSDFATSSKSLDPIIQNQRAFETAFFLYTSYDPEVPPDEVFEAVLFLLQCSSRKNTPLALSVLGKVIIESTIRQKMNHLITTGEIIRICWKATLDCKKSAYFRPSADKTMKIIGYLTNFQEMAGNKRAKQNLDCLYQVVEEILRQGDKVPELKISLLRCSKMIENGHLRTKILIDCMVHGDVLRQDQIIEIELCNKLHQLLVDDYGRLFKNYESFNLDAMVRLRSFAETSSCSSGFDFFMLLLDKVKGLNKKRYFENSLVHRTYLRILQMILIKLPLTFKNQQQVDTLLLSVRDIFLHGNHQTSVYILLEWILTLICVRFAEARAKIWEILNLVRKEKPNSVPSILRVIYNMFRSMNKKEQNKFAELKLSEIFTFCMDQNFSTRLHSQFVFKKIFESCGNVHEKFKLVAEAVERNLQSSENAVATFSALENDFYLTEFNAVLHCNPECILYDIPRLTSVCSSEYTNRDTIRKVFDPKMFNSTNNLEHVLITKKKHQVFDQDIDYCSDDLTNAQKKMMPWKSLGGEKSGLVVVASLVERVPNLGGIARTCEIFGAKQLVISNIEHVRNKEFLNLSVSAEKWLQIDQVKPNELVEYIIQKKRDGYTIIGAEQTVNSVNLKDMTWPKNAVLILGHEKSGIPADIIPILDQCVEIPQLGIIRSLNVHVSAALCIWQYVVNNLL